MFFSQCFMGVGDVTVVWEIFNTESAKGDFAVAPYSFEIKYSKGEESFGTSSGEEFEGSDEKILGRLLNLEWFIGTWGRDDQMAFCVRINMESHTFSFHKDKNLPFIQIFGPVVKRMTLKMFQWATLIRKIYEIWKKANLQLNLVTDELLYSDMLLLLSWMDNSTELYVF